MFARKHPKRFLLNVDCFLMFAINSEKKPNCCSNTAASTMYVDNAQKSIGNCAKKIDSKFLWQWIQYSSTYTYLYASYI